MSAAAERIAAIEARIAAACRAAGRPRRDVTLVAVSKRQPVERLQAAYQAGLRDFGENYVQALDERRRLLGGDVRWHLIGHVQTNKAKRASLASLVHTVDSERLAQALGKAASERGATLEVLIEVNQAGEATKAGVPPAEVLPLLEAARAIPGLRVTGLMCIPPEGEGRRWFAALRALREELEGRLGAPLPQLSMGMSADFEAAILEGATLVRVGTALFGERS